MKLGNKFRIKSSLYQSIYMAIYILWLYPDVCLQLRCESIKNDAKLLPITPRMLTDFQNSFTGRFSGKFATNMFKYPTTHDICRYTTM